MAGVVLKDNSRASREWRVHGMEEAVRVDSLCRLTRRRSVLLCQ